MIDATSTTPDIEDQLASLALCRQPGVGAARFVRLVREHGSPARALAAFRPDGRRPKSPTSEGLSRATAWVLAGRGRLLWAGGPAYPRALLDLGEPPPVLFVRGDVATASGHHGRMVAIVGARGADEFGRAAARALGRRAAQLGFVVASGGAKGVDAEAHRGALEAGGRTVAVVAHGIDVVYPPGHEGLFDAVAAQGAMMTELLPGAPPRASFFVTRNRIVAGLARGLVVVQGSAASGALTTARWARRLGRPVAVIPWGNTSLDEAPRRLAQGGAMVLRDATSLDAWLQRL